MEKTIELRPCCALCEDLYDKEKCPLYNVYSEARNCGVDTFDETAKYKVCCSSFVLNEKFGE